MKKYLLVFLLLNFSLLQAFSQWSSESNTNLQISSLPGEDVIPKIAAGPDGSYYVGYFSQGGGNYNVMLQRLDPQGNIMWQENGILVSSHPSMSWLTDWDMTVDSDNHAILTWQDIRLSGNNNIVAYRISPQGDFVWGADGIMLSEGGAFDVSPKVVVTAANNAVIAWQSENVIIRQKLNSQGVKQWGDWGITMSWANSYSWPQLLAVGHDDVIMKFFADSGPAWAPNRNILAQRFGADGQPVWASNTIVYNQGSISAWTQILPFINDGQDGFYIAWHEYTHSNMASAWVQHVTASGGLVFEQNGVLVSDLHSFNQFHPVIARPQADSNVYVYWSEVNGDQNFYGITGQKVSPAGQILWGSQGRAITPLTTQPVYPFLLMPVESDVVLFYQGYISASSNTIEAMRLDNEGERVWTPDITIISSAGSGQSHIHPAGFSSNQWVLAWEDSRGGSANIYGQNLKPNGSLGISNTFYDLMINVDGNGSIEVNQVPYSQPVSIEEGTVIHLQAFADQGWEFTSWSGDLISTLPVESITMNGNKQITAHFSMTPPPLNNLILTAIPENGGTTDGSGEYYEGETVTISATPAQGFIFINWTNEDGDEISNSNVYEFSMPAEDVSWIANFQSTVSASVESSGKLSIFPNPASGYVRIKSENTVNSINIIDLTGKTVFEDHGLNGRQLQIDVAHLKAGNYFIRLVTANGVVVRKLQLAR